VCSSRALGSAGNLVGWPGDGRRRPQLLCASLTAPPGAVFLYPDEPTSTAFAGNNFALDGNDRNLNGTPGPEAAVPGIATRNLYRDPLAPAGLAQIRLKAGAEGRARIRVVGKGMALGLPPLPLPLPITAQLQAADGACWEAHYSASGVKQDTRRFRGLSEAP